MSEQTQSSDKKQEESQLDIQYLLDYISNLSMLMADADRDAVYKFLINKPNLEFLRSFSTRENIHNFCLVINEDESPEPGKEYFLKADPTIKPYPSANIIFIKKIPVLDCSDIKKIKKDLQILNFNIESNDSSMITHIQNCIKSTFLSLFASYKEVIKDQKMSAIKNQNAQLLTTKVSELVDSINKTWKSSDINQFKLEFEPFFIEKLEKIKKEKGRDATVDEMLEGLEDDQKRKLTESIFKWKSDISKIIQANRSINEGNTLDEIEFWLDYVKVLKNIKKKIESKEVQMALAVAKRANKGLIANVFEKDIKTDDNIKLADSYNILFKDLPVKQMYNSNSLDDLTIQIQKIFDEIGRRMKFSEYPLKRLASLIECLYEDIYGMIIKIVGPNLMKGKYEDFIDIYNKCKHILKQVLTNEFNELSKEIKELSKKRNEADVSLSSLHNDSLKKRLKDVKKFRLENKELIEITRQLTKSNNPQKQEESQITKDIISSFKLCTTIDVLDLTEKGSQNWISAKSAYYKVIEKIEGQISNSLSEQLASAQNVNEQFRIFEKFKLIIK